jgi:hypothetical protein
MAHEDPGQSIDEFFKAPLIDLLLIGSIGNALFLDDLKN